MVRTSFIILAAFLFVASVQGKSNHSKILEEKAAKTPPTTPPTTAAPITTPPTTTAGPPKTTTVPPKTTTAAPNTTLAPITTPAPSPSSTPLPPAAKGKWAFSDDSNKTCVIVQMAMQFNLTYHTKDSNMSQAIFDLPVNGTKVTGGSCGKDIQYIILSWPVDKTNLTNNLTLTFDKNTTTDKFSLQTLELAIVQDEAHFPATDAVNKTLKLTHSGDTFSTPLTMSYRCVKMQDVTFESSDKNNSTVAISDVQFQAFHTDKGSVFGSANDCDYVDVPDIVPIAVGCALGGLVLIVLVAYLVGRRRSRAQGYLSM